MPRRSVVVGGGVGASRPAKVAPAHRPAAQPDVSQEILRLTHEIADRAATLKMLQAEKRRQLRRRSVQTSRSKSEKKHSARSATMSRLSQKIGQMTVAEEDGGALTAGERAILARRAAKGESKLGYSKTGRKLNPWQSFVQLHMAGVPAGELKSRLKVVAAEWQALKK